jgi:hypothetical protein
VPKPRPLPPNLRGGPFRVATALDEGVTSKRLRASDLERPFHGVRVGSAEVGVIGTSTPGVSESDRAHHVARARSYLPILGEGGSFSHSTAAAIYGFPLAMAFGSTIHVSSPTQSPRGAGVTGHRGIRATRVVNGFPLADPAMVWVQLSTLVSLDDLIIVGDFLVQRKNPLCTVDDLITAAALPGVRGIRAIRRALRDVRSGTDSPMETRLRLLIVRGGLPEPTIGYTIRDRAGDFVGTPDLSYIRERIAIEYEGDVHRANRAVFAEDIERRELMQELDWYVIRVTSDHVFKHPKWLVTRISRQLSERSFGLTESAQ